MQGKKRHDTQQQMQGLTCVTLPRQRSPTGWCFFRCGGDRSTGHPRTDISRQDQANCWHCEKRLPISSRWATVIQSDSALKSVPEFRKRYW